MKRTDNMKNTYFISGTSSGIAEDVTKNLLAENNIIIGCGLEDTQTIKHENFYYFKCDVTNFNELENYLKVVLETNNIKSIE